MGAAFRLPGVDIEALKAQWQAQLSKLPGFSPDLFQSWVQQSPMAGLNVPGLKPVQQAVDAVSHSVSDDLQSLAGLKVDPDTLATTAPGVFVAGDLAHGTRLLIDAVASGKAAARSVKICPPLAI